jgi:hypothetical protein
MFEMFGVKDRARPSGTLASDYSSIHIEVIPVGEHFYVVDTKAYSLETLVTTIQEGPPEDVYWPGPFNSVADAEVWLLGLELYRSLFS